MVMMPQGSSSSGSAAGMMSGGQCAVGGALNEPSRCQPWAFLHQSPPSGFQVSSAASQETAASQEPSVASQKSIVAFQEPLRSVRRDSCSQQSLSSSPPSIHPRSRRCYSPCTSPSCSLVVPHAPSAVSPTRSAPHSPLLNTPPVARPTRSTTLPHTPSPRSSSAAPPARSLRGTFRRLLQRCQLSDDVALQALEGRLQLLDAHRALSSVRCQQFVTAFEGPHRGGAVLDSSQGATAAESTHRAPSSVRCQQFVTAFKGPLRVAAFEGPHRELSRTRLATSESWGDDADCAAGAPGAYGADGAGDADGPVMGAVALEAREPTGGGPTEADFADENSSDDGGSTGAGQCTPHARSWMADLAYYNEPRRSNSFHLTPSFTSTRSLASTPSFSSTPSRGLYPLGSTPSLDSTPSYTSNGDHRLQVAPYGFCSGIPLLQ
ncbi:unnamed protein product [Closterium sp. NIES-65]|nr:unnamed protein product [Closterium sp. NIES-65]CAI6004651.1 unnamed protein product [Closterium sp. NIES-65]CAI6007540.1 unnamed protein product [Closterium sp. NIES-65]